MLTGTYVLVVGGDARQVYVMERLIQLDANVTAIGFEQCSALPNGVRTVPCDIDSFANADVLLLPLSGLNGQGEADAKYAGKPLVLTRRHFQNLPQHALVFTGIANPTLRMFCKEAGVECIALQNRDDFAIYNSVPTAEGAIALAIEHSPLTIHGAQAAVLGFGRIGMTLSRLLKAMGAHVRIGVLTDEQYARAWEMGLAPFYTADPGDRLDSLDLLFNTIPSMIITAHWIARLASHTVIIDLASGQGGTDFRFAAKRNMKAVLAPSLPGIVAPRTAGLFVAATLSQMILDKTKERSN